MKSKEFKILIIDEAHNELMQALKDFHIDYRPEIDSTELEQIISAYDALVVRSKLVIDRAWIDRATKLKIIGRLGSGLDNIDIAYAEQRGVVCLNAPEGNKDAVAEQTIGMLLSLLSNIHRSWKELNRGKWDRKNNSGIELNSLSVGIIGYGNIGESLASKLKSFGCKVLAYDLYLQGFDSDIVKESKLEDLQEECDVISLHVPLNEASLKMLNAEFINKMNKPFYLLNLSRGDVIHTEDVVQGIRTGKIRGAALDVFENEKLEELSEKQRSMLDYLVDHPNCLVTPHIGGLTNQSFEKLAKVLGQKMNTEIYSNHLLTQNNP